MDFVGGADEDKGGQNDIQHGILGEQHEDAVSVSRQPNMVLGDKQLQRDLPKPSEERRIPSSKPS